jgi:hypothetical protein
MAAVLDVAHGLGFLTVASRRWLLAETGCDSSAVNANSRRPDEINLDFDVRDGRHSPNSFSTLSSKPAGLHESPIRWPEPLTDSTGQALRYVNRRLGAIRIHAQESSRFLRWAPADCP